MNSAIAYLILLLILGSVAIAALMICLKRWRSPPPKDGYSDDWFV